MADDVAQTDQNALEIIDEGAQAVGRDALDADWRQVRLRDLIEFSRDGEWGSAEPSEGSNEAAVIRGTDFAAVGEGDLSRVPVRHIATKRLATKTIRAGDIIIETAGGSKNRPTGRTLLVYPRLLVQANRPIVCASFCRSVRIKPQVADPAYVYWYLKNLYLSGAMAAFHTQHTGVARFQWTDFASAHKVPLPPTTTQQQITQTLCAFDELIEINRRRIELLEDLARSLYREWFVHFRFPGHEDVELVDSELGPIPEGWTIACLDDVADVVVEGIHPSELEPVSRYVGLEHLPRRRTTLREWGSIGSVSSRKLLFSRGDTLFGKIRPYFHKVAWAPFAAAASSDTIVFRAHPDHELTAFVNAVASSDELVAKAVATSNGTKMPRADPKALLAYELPLPSEDLLLEFEYIVRMWVELSAVLVLQNHQLATTRDLLLPRLVTGRLDISDIDLGVLTPTEAG